MEAATIQEEMARIAGRVRRSAGDGEDRLLRSPRRRPSHPSRALPGQLSRALERTGDLANEEFSDCAEPLARRDSRAQEQQMRPSPAQTRPLGLHAGERVRVERQAAQTRSSAS